MKRAHVVRLEAVVPAVAAGEHGDARLRQAGEARVGPRAGAGEARGRDPVRRGEGDKDVRPAQPVVLRNPDQVGGRGSGARVLEDDREGAPAGCPLDGAHVRHGAAAGGDQEIREREPPGDRRDGRRLARIDRPERHEPGERRTRRDAPDFGRHPERLGDAEALRLVARLAVAQDPGRQMGQMVLRAATPVHPPIVRRSQEA